MRGVVGIGLLLLSIASLAGIAPPLRAADGVTLDGVFTQGGLIVGKAAPGARVTLDGRPLRLAADGSFVFGFHRDAPAAASLLVYLPDGAIERRTLAVAPRKYKIDRIDGLPRNKVTPNAEELARIERENKLIAAARLSDSDGLWFLEKFIWPAKGRISGVYGSQRILNGEPRQPHFGIDIAGPVGADVAAPAGGIVTLAERDLFFTGGTIMIDHGHGVSSAFLHLSAVDVKVGQTVRQGERIGALGATGRVSGPHLDWRMNWFDARIDPAFLVPPRS